MGLTIFSGPSSAEGLRTDHRAHSQRGLLENRVVRKRVAFSHYVGRATGPYKHKVRGANDTLEATESDNSIE